MPTLYVTKGLPGSGKTHWSQEKQREDPNLVLVSKDDIRAMLHGGRWSKGNEKQVLRIRDAIVRDTLLAGHNLVLHDTNLHQSHIARMHAIAQELRKANNIHVDVEVVDFTDVPLQTCIERDLLRPRSVGEKVIRRMWYDFLAPQPLLPPTYNPDLPDAVVCDLDGSLALLGGRSPYDSTGLCLQDTVSIPVARILQMESDLGTDILITSGRDEVVRGFTEEWLSANHIPYAHLFMRIADDRRPDTTVKKEIYEKYMEGQYNIRYIIDDRPSVCRMWRSLSLSLFQVGDPDVDF
jgi:predicted kinase